MIIDALRILFDRDIILVQKEIGLYRDEASIWRVEGAISNSAGNLCLHLAGNLNTYIGHALGGTNYVRQRDVEFSAKNVAREELLQMLEKTRTTVRAALAATPEEKLSKPFPVIIRDEETQTGYTLIQLAMHLNYHLGQINYHRRLLDKTVTG